MIGRLIEMEYKKRAGYKQGRRLARQEMCRSVAKIGEIYTSKELLELVSKRFPHNQKTPKSSTSLAQSLRGCDSWEMVKGWPHGGRYGWRRVA